MADLASQCKILTNQLLAVLSKLKSDGSSNKWKSFLQALRSQWHDSEIENLRKRLDHIGQAVQARLYHIDSRLIIDRLNTLLERNRQLEISRMADIQALQAQFAEVLRSKEDSGETLTKIAHDGFQYNAEQWILSELRFVRLEDRYSSVSDAHRKTLTWLFGTTDTPGRNVPAANFVEWLRSENKIYWISGRPGSGKSTLMKFLCTHPKTTTHLAEWSQGNDIVIAEYFFWNAGKNRLQKSQEGLLRSILSQILRQYPDYIQMVYTATWRHYSTESAGFTSNGGNSLDSELPLDLSGLMDALKRTCKLLTQASKRLFLLIDGLDEYEGDKLDIISLIVDLKSLDLVKICVSSRQWNEFEDAFGRDGTSKLYMQDFNDEDISSYIDDVLSRDENYQELEDKETRGQALIAEIVSKSNGVFLWVVLVVRSFQEGLREGDSIARLQHRLQDLPAELEEYFERILFQDVKQTYRDQAAQMFLVALEAKENLPLMAYWFLDEPELPKERQPLKMQQTVKRHRAAKKRLIASCKGLLEPNFLSEKGQQDSLPSAILFEYKVDFLHRTVRDYLELPTTKIRDWVPRDFDPHMAICRVLFAQIKTAPQDVEYGPHILDLCKVFHYHAKVVLQAHARDRLVLKLKAEISDIEKLYSISTTDLSISQTLKNEINSAAETGNGENTVPIIVKPAGEEAPIERPSTLKRWASKLGLKRSKSNQNT